LSVVGLAVVEVSSRLTLDASRPARLARALSGRLLPFFKDHRLSRITIAEVNRYRTGKVREREAGGGLSNRSINDTLNLLAQVLETAVEYGHIQFNSARGRRRRLKAAQPTRTWLEPEQVKPLLDAAVRGLRGGGTMPDPRMRTLFAAGICTGLRIGELLALRRRDVNLAQGRLTVTDSKTEAGKGARSRAGEFAATAIG